MIKSTRFVIFVFFLAIALSNCSNNRNAGLSQKQIEKLILAEASKLDSPDIWAGVILESLKEIGIPATKKNVCAVIAVISQESGFKTVPKTRGLPEILLKKLKNAETNELYRQIIEIRLNQYANNGKTFRRNIYSIVSERDVEIWYNEFVASEYTKPVLILLKKDISDLITTLGSMQVSVRFAEKYPKKPENIASNEIRDILYTCKGGVFYGAAFLLDYNHNYQEMMSVFADYNAGHYACRNAGFQKMLANLTQKNIVLDGDLLNYKDGEGKPGKTYALFINFLIHTGMDFEENKIRKDFEKEKSLDFEETFSYKTLSALHKTKFGNTIYEEIPQISLKSDKFLNKNLSTYWFALRAKSRYNNCMRTKI